MVRRMGQFYYFSRYGVLSVEVLRVPQDISLLLPKILGRLEALLVAGRRPLLGRGVRAPVLKAKAKCRKKFENRKSMGP